VNSRATGNSFSRGRTKGKLLEILFLNWGASDRIAVGNQEKDLVRLESKGSFVFRNIKCGTAKGLGLPWRISGMGLRVCRKRKITWSGRGTA